MKRAILTPLLLSSTLAGCSTILLDPIDNSAGGGPTTSSAVTTVTTGTGTSSPGRYALALNGSDVPPHSLTWNGDFAAPWSNPDNLVLFLSNVDLGCAAPALSSTTCGAGQWQTILVIPPELVHVGVIDLRHPSIGVYELLYDASCNQALGSGNGFWGTLEIVEMPSDHVTFALRDSGGSGHPPANGDYLAHRCTPPPPEAAPKPAFAIRAKDLPADSTISASDPDALVITATTRAETCATAFSPLTCADAERLTVVLPPAKVGVGPVSFQDPTLSARYTVSATQGSPACPEANGALTDGTLDVRTLDASGLSFHLTGTFTPITDFPLFEVDGLYAASMCP